jgi:hypothetical protein
LGEAQLSIVGKGSKSREVLIPAVIAEFVSSPHRHVFFLRLVEFHSRFVSLTTDPSSRCSEQSDSRYWSGIPL